MKILFVTYNYGDTASGIISYRVANEIAKQGHDVRLLCCHANTGNIDGISHHVISCILNNNTIISRLLRKAGRILQTLIFEYDWIWIKKCEFQIDQLFKTWEPNFVYCRSTPFEPFFLGKYVKKKYGCRVLMHFTDPSPAISEYPNRKCFIKKQTKLISRLINFADKISFGTFEMMKNEELLCNTSLKKKSFISPDVTSESEPVFRNYINHSALCMAYFGYINISRNPIPLFEAVEKLNSEGLNCQLFIYSSQSKEFREFNYVHFVGRSKDRDKALSEADVLVDLTVEESLESDVYISSKLKDYLLYNRPILSISGAHCATRSLLTGLKTAFSTPNNTDSIANTIKRINSIVLSDIDYEERRGIIQQFSPEVIVNTIIEEFE